MADLGKTVDFNILRYANCWEDPLILLRGLAPASGSRILSIGSAGDNSFSLLTTDPEMVVAVDVNQVQLFLISLKKASIRCLEYEDTLSFLGFRDSAKRAALFNEIKPTLTPAERQYWDNNLVAIEKGVIHQGKFERYFQLFAKRVLPFIHSKKKVEQLLSPKDDLDQGRFYHEKWNTWRWRLFFNVFFSRRVMGKFGRDPMFLKEVGLDVSAYIFKKAGKHLKKTQAQSNPILRYNLTGDFGTLLPHYLQPENYDVVKRNLDKLLLRKGYAEQVAKDYGHFDSMNLSNIFEYMDKESFRSTAEQLLPNLKKGGRMGYWNLMVPRRVSGIFPSEIEYLGSLSKQLTEEDNGFFYNQFIIDQR